MAVAARAVCADARGRAERGRVMEDVRPSAKAKAPYISEFVGREGFFFKY